MVERGLVTCWFWTPDAVIAPGLAKELNGREQEKKNESNQDEGGEEADAIKRLSRRWFKKERLATR